MNPFQRLAAGLRFAFTGKAAFELMPAWQDGTAAAPVVNFENNYRNGYRADELVFACIVTKAENASAAFLETYDLKTEEATPDTPLAALLAKPNEELTQHDMLGLIMMHLDLAGRSYWEKQRSRRGEVISLWPLRPDWVKPIRANGYLSAYEYRPPGTPGTMLRKEDVLDFKLVDPLNWYGSMSPVGVCMRAAGVSVAMSNYISLFFSNGGVPPGLLKTKVKLQEEGVTQLRQRWMERYSGYRNWLGPVILDMDAEYQKTGFSFEEMGFDIVSDRVEAKICSVLRVPPILVGAKVGLDRSTFSNAQESQVWLWEKVLMPQFRRVVQELQSDLAPEFGDNVGLRWDYSEVPELQENKDSLYTRTLAAVQQGVLTRNEARAELGFDIVDNGDVFLMPAGLIEVPTDASLIDVTPEPAAEEDDTEAQDDENQLIEDRWFPALAASAGNPTSQSLVRGRRSGRGRKAKPPKDQAARNRHERAMSKALSRFFSGQQKRVMAAIDTSGV